VKLYVDDIREAPEGWQSAEGFSEAVALLQYADVEALSLDHDLGLQNFDPEMTGYDIAKWMVRHCVWPKDIYCHSMNPVGRQNIIALLKHYAPAGVVVHA
jgi:hypothetical protein